MIAIYEKFNPFRANYNLKFGAPLGHYFKIPGLFWGILRPMKGYEKQLDSNSNPMILNGFYQSLAVFSGLKYWWRRRELNPRPQALCH